MARLSGRRTDHLLVGSSDLDDVHEVLQTPEVFRAAGEDRKVRCTGGRGDQKIESSSPARLSSARDLRGVDPAIGAGSLSVEWKGSKAASARCNRSCRRARSSTSRVACGPAASSAMVIALTASSIGSCSASRCSRSMTTDVSMIPRGRRWGSDTRARVLECNAVEVGAEPG